MPFLQTEVSTLSPQVGFYDHRRALLTAENVLLKQKLAALSQSQRYKEGEFQDIKLKWWGYVLSSQNLVSPHMDLEFYHVWGCSSLTVQDLLN